MIVRLRVVAIASVVGAVTSTSVMAQTTATLAYFIGGFGMTALTANNIVVVPIRSGIGLRLGANLGYLKFSDSPTWNPF